MIDLYVQQVKKCCNCFECASDEQWKYAVTTALVEWGAVTCGNWIDNHDITLKVPVSKKCGECCPNILRVNLPEEWVQEDTIKVTVRAWLGLELTEIEVNHVFDDVTHDLMIDMSNAIDCCNRCLKYDVVIEYTVGTDTIPADLCRWFCAIAKVYMELEEIGCTQCGSEDDISIIEVDGATDLSASIKYLAVKYFENMVAQHSLCLLKSLKDWTVVV